MFYAGTDWTLAPSQVFFAHMIVMDSDSGLAMTLGRTYVLTQGAPEVLSRAGLELIVR